MNRQLWTSWRGWQADLRLDCPDEPVLSEELQVLRLVRLRHPDLRPARLELRRCHAVLLVVVFVDKDQVEVSQLYAVPARVHPIPDERNFLLIEVWVDRLHVLQRHWEAAHRLDEGRAPVGRQRLLVVDRQPGDPAEQAEVREVVGPRRQLRVRVRLQRPAAVLAEEQPAVRLQQLVRHHVEPLPPHAIAHCVLTCELDRQRCRRRRRHGRELACRGLGKTGTTELSVRPATLPSSIALR